MIAMNDINISLDDVKGIFKVLSGGNMESIFETRSLAFLQQMHDRYDTRFILFCTCKDGNYALEKVPEKYLEEFLENADWLQFGFHCFEESDNYETENLQDFMVKLEYYAINIRRCTGQNGFPAVIRLHGFKGNRDIIGALRDRGVRIFFTSDDRRQNYYLNEEQCRELETNRKYYDANMDVSFIKSCTRLENSDEIVNELKRGMKFGKRVLPVFTHEWQMDREDIREKIRQCCKYTV